MIVAELTDTGIAAAVTMIGGAFVGVYVLLRKTGRDQRNADKESDREQFDKDAAFWRRQYEESRASDAKWQSRIVEQMDSLGKRHTELEHQHFKCEQEHAQARGQLASLQREGEARERRIADLEKLLGKA